ncbi:MAG: glycosyltransferase [Chlamydiae bacterium]|nr:glycosyltransferase [Chlamydiota bacterium]MBI3266525.1 glycosyltransferase [Chlamydiota bacterium]
MEISQFVSGFMDGDAISNFSLELQKVIRSWGVRSEIYGVGRHVNTLVPGRCLDVKTYKRDPSNIAIFHFSVGSEMSDFFKSLSEKRVLIYHNITPAKYFHSISEEKAVVLRKGREELLELASVPDLTLAVSPYNAQELKEAGFSNPQVFPLMLNLDDLNTPPRKKILRQHQKSPFNLVFVGRVAPNKKIDDVILSFYYFKKLYEPLARLFIVGAYAGMDLYLAYLRALTIELDLQDVFFTNHIAQCNLVAYYRLADVFLCMSEHEGFCIPLLEAMYFDVPVMAYHAAGVPGTLAGSGILFHKKDHPAIAEMMMMLHQDANFRQAVIQKQRNRLKDFDRGKWAQEFRKLLDPLMR